jgi:hypothetical protein
VDGGLVSTVTSLGLARVRIRDVGTTQPTTTRGAKMSRKKSEEGVPALQNDDVTGMTEEKQEEVIRESGRAPRRKAAEEFYDEQQDQAADTKPGEAKRQSSSE